MNVIKRLSQAIRITNGNLITDLSLWLIILLPLILWAGVYKPFSFGRFIMFMFLVAVLMLGVIFTRKLKSYSRWWKNPIVWILLAWLLFTIISAIFGENLVRSFWGTVSRSTGILFLLGLSAFLLAIVTIVTSRDNWIKIFSAMSWVGGFVALHTVSQKFNLSSVFIINYGDRMGGLLGNPLFLGQFLLLTIFLTMYFWTQSSGLTKWLYGLSFVLQFLAVLLTISRAPIIALIVGLIIWGSGYLIISRSHNQIHLTFNWHSLWKWIVGGIIGLSAILIGFIYTIVPSTSFERLIDFTLSSKSIKSRWEMWQILWEAFTHRPWLGYGIENVRSAFVAFYQPAGLSFSETIIDRAHNLFLDQLIINGMIGLMLLVSLLGILLIVLWRHFKKVYKHKKTNSAILTWSLIVTLVCYVIANLTSFDIVTTMIYEIILLGGIIVMIRPQGEVLFSVNWLKWLFVPLAIVMIWNNATYLRPAFTIGQYIKTAYSAEKSGNYGVAHNFYIKAQEIINPYRFPLLLKFPGFTVKYGATLLIENQIDRYMSLITDGLRVLNSISDTEPDRTELRMIYPAMYALMSKSNPMYAVNAEESFRQFTDNYPNHEYAYILWARALLVMDRPLDAIETLNDASQKFTSFAGVEFWRAVIYIQLDHPKYHDQIINNLQADFNSHALGLLSGDIAPQTLQSIVAYLVEAKQWDMAEYYQVAVVELLPNSIEDRINLAVIYKEMGEYEKAAEQAKIVVDIDPSKAEITQLFLESIK